MSRTVINVGSAANDGTGDPLRTAWIAQNAMNVELYATLVGIVSGNWFNPFFGQMQSGAAITANNIKLLPFIMPVALSIGNLGGRVTTASAGNNCQFALYNADQATGHPTTLIGATGNVSVGSTGTVSGAISGGAVTCPAGLCFMAVNQDNSAAAYNTLNAAMVHSGRLIGSSSLPDLFSTSSVNAFSLGVSQTFGTWPDLTAASPSKTTGVTSAALALKVA